jgi:hypothetical protein
LGEFSTEKNLPTRLATS